MTRADIFAGLLLAAGFGAMLWEASTFQYGTEFAPGPGFAPIWYGVLGIALSLAISALALRRARAPESDAEAEPEALDRGGLARVGATLLGLALLIAIVPWLGLLPSMLAFLVVLTLGIQRLPLLLGLGASLATVCFIYVVFVRLLGVPIPTGLLGF